MARTLCGGTANPRKAYPLLWRMYFVEREYVSMPYNHHPNTEIWAQLHLSSDDCSRVRQLLSHECGINKRCILREMHITVYYARRPMRGINPLVEPASVIVPSIETRFMVMTPGGEKPDIGIDPSAHMIGVRIQRKCSARPKIMAYRKRLLGYETQKALGKRRPSSIGASAFGARAYQPHMVILRPGNGIQRDLFLIGRLFREQVDNLHFDKFEIKIVHRKGMLGSYKTKIE